MTKKIVNPNQPFNPAQIAQLMERFMDVNVIPASVKFPLATEGGIAETAFASAMGYPKDMSHWYPTGLSTGAAAIIAVLHGRFGSRFPEILIFGQPPDFPFLGTVELDAVRHKARETRYENKGPANKQKRTIVLNFSHPFTDTQGDEIARLVGDEWGIQPIGDLSRQYRYNTAEELAEQVREQVAAAGISPWAWQNCKIVVNLPAHSGGAMIALVEMHGRMGYFPTVLRVERAEDGFHFTEAIDLEKLRLRALTEMQEGRQRDVRNAIINLVKFLTDRDVLSAMAQSDAVTIWLPDGAQRFYISRVEHEAIQDYRPDEV